MRTAPILPLILLLLAGRPAVAEPVVRLTVSIDGLESRDGAVNVALFDAEAAFDRGGQPVRKASVPATGANVVVFDGLPPGRYALRAFHDRNGDGRLDMNGLGVPKEPYAFSNNARGVLGPARWKDAAFNVTVGGTAQTLTLR